jgi:hypothetical protein
MQLSLLGAESDREKELGDQMQRALKRRITPLHSELFDHIWKTRFTNEQNPVISLRAMGRKTSATDFSSVPTPQKSDDNQSRRSAESMERERIRDGRSKSLAVYSTLSAVPTPCANKITKNSKDPQRMKEGGVQTALADAAHLASVPTPMAGSPATETYNAAGNTDYSRRIVELASIGTPRSVESGPDGSIRTRLDQLPRQAQLADSGPTATGGSGATGSTGQLNPEYSLWLMGIPTEWVSFVSRATQSLSRRRKRLSKPISN